MIAALVYLSLEAIQFNLFLMHTLNTNTIIILAPWVSGALNDPRLF